MVVDTPPICGALAIHRVCLLSAVPGVFCVCALFCFVLLCFSTFIYSFGRRGNVSACLRSLRVCVCVSSELS